CTPVSSLDVVQVSPPHVTAPPVPVVPPVAAVIPPVAPPPLPPEAPPWPCSPPVAAPPPPPSGRSPCVSSEESHATSQSAQTTPNVSALFVRPPTWSLLIAAHLLRAGRFFPCP